MTFKVSIPTNCIGPMYFVFRQSSAFKGMIKEIWFESGATETLQAET